MDDALLAWEMNGEPVPHAHGGPLRLIVPGYSGVNNIKYIKRLAFTAAETDAAIQKTGYRMSPPGQKGDPSQPCGVGDGRQVLDQRPAPEAGPARRAGCRSRAWPWAASNAAARVDVSTDGGKTGRRRAWSAPISAAYAWRQFVLPVRLAPGSYLIASRATDAQGTCPGRGNAGQRRRLPQQRLARARGADHGRVTLFC